MTEGDFKTFVQEMAGNLDEHVFGEIYDVLQKFPGRRETLNPAFPYPKILRIGALKTHLVVEYVGPQESDKDNYEVQAEFSPNKTIFDFLGIEVTPSTPMLQVPSNIENMQFFVGDAMTILGDYLYDVVANPNDIALNTLFDVSTATEPTFMSNVTIFWSDSEGAIRTRRIDFAEIMPIHEDGYAYHTDDSLKHFGNFLANYQVPRYKLKLHEVLNEFISLVGSGASSETEITRYLAKHPQILQLAFGANDINPEKELVWQYEAGKANLRPDFLIVKMDGYADIVEFKLPRISGAPMVGTDTRHKPSAVIESALAQVDEYDEWCNQEVNRSWLEKTHDIKVHTPQTYLIVGHRDDFSSEDRQKLRRRRNAVIFTYDEFIDLARCQLYRMR
ncbi:Shedu anti-phage system protein SduA domain-containing protein [Cupriavidus basilensis]|uniref:DUF4263 domain-containing protein n=1 Tax=Cupriavidus basilensis TaxID=68895 RepID=A0A643FHX9_9BURK|nr:Shedu anti-phage system protein SduA domain-containing protein [Cupriavidus basilensis]QOT76338.1 DUF4263 domain-containing protein [Cupriavidus basilensis]